MTRKEVTKKISEKLKEMQTQEFPDINGVKECIALIKEHGLEQEMRTELIVLTLMKDAIEAAVEVKAEMEAEAPKNTFKEAAKEEVEEECDCPECKAKDMEEFIDELIAKAKAEKEANKAKEKEFDEAAKKATGKLVFTVIKTDGGMEVELDSKDFSEIERMATIEMLRRAISED